MPRKVEYAKNPEYHREGTRRYYWAHREERLAYAREWRRQNAPKLKRPHVLRYSHQMTEDAYKSLFQSQSGVCAVCRQPPPPNRSLAVDHCHVTGLIRGLLCNNCNAAIGNAKELAERLLALAQYLEGPFPDVPRLPPPRQKRKLPRPKRHTFDVY